MPPNLTHDASRLTQSEWVGISDADTEDLASNPRPTMVVRMSRPEREWSLLAKDPDWVAPLFEGLNRVAALAPNWDSYGAPKISVEAIRSAIEVMNFHAPPRAPAPEVVPMSSGGIQLEWHENGVDFEISCLAERVIEFALEDHRTGRRSSGSVRRFSADLEQAFKLLVAR